MTKEKTGVSDDQTKSRILATLFLIYEKAAADCAKNGCVQKSKKTGYEQVRPQYTVMNDMLDRILELKPEFKANGKSEGHGGKKKKEIEETDFETD